MLDVVDIWNYSILYAGQEHVPFFLDIAYKVHEKRDERHGNLLHTRVGQRE